jgi:putative transposase
MEEEGTRGSGVNDPYELRNTSWVGTPGRLGGEPPNHDWSYNFVMAQTNGDKDFRLLTIIDEYIRECLIIEVSRRLDEDAEPHRLTQMFVGRRPPDYLRSDNGPESTARAVWQWLNESGSKRFTSSRAALGRIVTTRAWRCEYYTGGPTVPWDTAHQRPKPER